MTNLPYGLISLNSFFLIRNFRTFNIQAHCMNKTKKAFRLIVIRRPYQGNLFVEEDPGLKYTAIATNRIGSAEAITGWYNQRGECSENRIKELKIGFGMERMPCGEFEANAVFFRIGVLAYNIHRLFVLKTLGSTWHRHQVQTVRWRLYQAAGKIVFHGGQVFLKLARSFCQLFQDIRLRIMGICRHLRTWNPKPAFVSFRGRDRCVEKLRCQGHHSVHKQNSRKNEPDLRSMIVL